MIEESRGQRRLHGRIVSPDQAVAGVNSGHRVFIHGAAATPHTLLNALAARSAELHDVRLIHLHTEGVDVFSAPEMYKSFRHEALFVGRNVRGIVNAGKADYIPVFLSEIPQLFRSGRMPIDVALLNVSPPDDHGYCSLGVSVDVAISAATHAQTIIAQINHAMPRTLGHGFIHVDQIDRAIEVDCPPADISCPHPTEVESRIGAFVASLIEDGATLQLGIGSIPNAVLASLRNHRDLGIHTEMFSDGVVDLVERGVINGTRNPIHPGKLVTSFLMGSQKLYDFANDNPQVEMHPADYTNDTAVIRRNHRMVAVNSAIEIDLTGQVCSSSIGDYIYSGFGGQVDFMRGAALAPEGRPILALPSTALGGEASRIVGHLREGAMVTLTQAHVHYVVTEFGIGELYGKSLSERAQALINIAHPNFRDELHAFAREHHRF